MIQSGIVLAFYRQRLRGRDWTQQELAEFYRVESALVQNGLAVTTDRGVTDEGDPWFVFCRAADEEVIAHFARIDQQYLVVSSAFSGVARGRDFQSLIRALLDTHPLMLPSRSGQGSRIFLHPAALLSALVTMAYLVSADDGGATGYVSSAADGQKGSPLGSLLRHEFAILSAVAIAATWVEKQVEIALAFARDKGLAGASDFAAPVHVAAAHALASPHGDALGLPDGAGATHKIEVQPFGLEAQADQGEHAVPAAGFKAVAPSATGLEKPADPSPTMAAAGFDAPRDTAHDAGPAAADMIATTVPVVAAELVTSSHQDLASAGPTEAAMSKDLSIGSGSLPASDASHLLAVDLGGSSGEPGPVVLAAPGDSVALALSQIGYSPVEVQTIGALLGSSPEAVRANQAPAGGAADLAAPPHPAAVTATAPPQQVTAPAPDLVAETGSVHHPSPAQADQILQSFLHDTPQVDIVTTHGSNDLVLVDTNTADAQSHDFGVAQLQMADGSTLALIGIIHHPAAIAAV